MVNDVEYKISVECKGNKKGTQILKIERCELIECGDNGMGSGFRWVNLLVFRNLHNFIHIYRFGVTQTVCVCVNIYSL